MKALTDKDFLLQTDTAQKLYRNQSPAATPILDYHCHINPKEIAEDRKFENITQVWLGGDHYKWRFIDCEQTRVGETLHHRRRFRQGEVLRSGLGALGKWPSAIRRIQLEPPGIAEIFRLSRRAQQGHR